MVYDFIFIVLVYRNTKDLEEFFIHQNTLNAKVIVVNSFYDDETERKFRKIAKVNDADFISVPNKGYGFGNNRGCEYALRKYKFKYLIISNADIEIRKMDVSMLQGCEDSIVAPQLLNKNGRNQNPSNPFVSSTIYLKLMHYVFANNKRYLLPFFSVVSRLKKIIFHLLCGIFNRNKIFAPHGAFTIFSYRAIKKLFPVYDEDIFLFCEEPHLGNLARKNKIPVIYIPSIKIYHKEDGSMRLASIDVFEKTRKSFLIFYDKWYV